jgi:hypothetical protein
VPSRSLIFLIHIINSDLTLLPTKISSSPTGSSFEASSSSSTVVVNMLLDKKGSGITLSVVEILFISSPHIKRVSCPWVV